MDLNQKTVPYMKSTQNFGIKNKNVFLSRFYYYT